MSKHMMQKDYILRMIQQLSRVLIHVLHLREVKDYDGALTYIDDVFKQALGFSSDLINSVPDETLLAMLTSFDVLDIEKCFLVANLLKAEGDIYVDQGDFDTSYYRYLRSLYLRRDRGPAGQAGGLRFARRDQKPAFSILRKNWPVLAGRGCPV